MTYMLEVNGQKRELTLNTPVTLDGTFSNPKVLLTAASTREFAYGDVEFNYPASFTWEASIDGPNDKTWTLSGNDFKIMYFVLPAVLSPLDYATRLSEKVGAPGGHISDVDRDFGGKQLKGKRVPLRIADADIVSEVFVMPSKKGCRMLVLQDSLPTSASSSSAEGAKTMAMLQQTFKDVGNP